MQEDLIIKAYSIDWQSDGVIFPSIY